MQKGSPLGIILVGILILAVIAGGYIYLTNNSSAGNGNGGTDSGLPTPIPPPPAEVYEATGDIEASRLIKPGDRELFSRVTVDVSQVSDDDIRANEFDQLVMGRVTARDIAGGARLKRSDFRDAGLIEQIPTPAPGQASRKIITVFVTDLGSIASPGATVDLLASYALESRYLYYVGNEFDPATGVTTILRTDASYSDISTKILAQDVPVMRIVEPVVPIDDTGAPPPPASDAPPADSNAPATTPEATAVPSFGPGAVWEVQLAVTDQEAELIQYTVNKFGVLSLIVRRPEDRELVSTTGVTMDLLMRLYGVAQPYAQPNILVDLVKAPPVPQPPSQAPLVVPVPPPFGNAAPAPLPTAEPTPAP